MPSVRPSLETGLRDASVQMAVSGTIPRTKDTITLYDLLDGLQVRVGGGGVGWGAVREGRGGLVLEGHLIVLKKMWSCVSMALK